MTTQTLMTPLLTHLERQTNLPILAALLVRAAIVVTQWNQLYRTRHHLRDLDPYLLKDIGLTEHQAKREFERPFWQG